MTRTMTNQQLDEREFQAAMKLGEDPCNLYSILVKAALLRAIRLNIPSLETTLREAFPIICMEAVTQWLDEDEDICTKLNLFEGRIPVTG
jgi:hypothetical protein